MLTFGGDAPGINAVNRAVMRPAIFNGSRVTAIYLGYKGLIDNDLVEFRAQESNIIQKGGTTLKSARCKAFHPEKGRELAYTNMGNAGIDA